MPIKIHGKDYYTVIERVNMLREKKQDFCITTEIIDSDGPNVIMKASILNMEGIVLATGHAEEVRGSTMINKTSALENCETSAIGRALASLGLGGTEFASANEVENAIYQQDKEQISPEPIRKDAVDFAISKYRELIDADIDETDKFPMMQAIDRKLSNDERMAVDDAFGKDKHEGGRLYRTLIKDYLKMKKSDFEISKDFQSPE